MYQQGAGTVMELATGCGLRARSRPDGEGLVILSPEGQTLLTVLWTAAGPVLRFEGEGLRIATAGTMSLTADRVDIHGREGVTIRSEGDLETRARIQNHEATRGNVNIRANDDVKLNGERVMVNC